MSTTTKIITNDGPNMPGDQLVIKGEAVKNLAITNNSGVSIEYSTNSGTSFTALATGGTASLGNGVPSIFRFRRATSGAYPLEIDATFDEVGSLDARLSFDTFGNMVMVGVDGEHVYLGPISNTRPNFEVSGTTTETEAARIQIPGGLLKANSAVLITTLWQMDGNDSKNLYMRAGDDATMTYGTSLRIGSYNGVTTQKSVGFTLLLHNNGSTGAQITMGNGTTQPFGNANTLVPVEVAVNTAIDWSIYLGATNSVVGDPVNKCILKSVIVELK